MTVIDYFIFIDSPFTYLGSHRFIELVAQYDVEVRTKPTRYRDIFAATGGQMPEDRSPQRRAYRRMELQRWREALEIPIVLAPTVFPAEEILGYRLVIATALAKLDTVRLTLEIGRSLWEQDKKIDDWTVLREAARRAGLDADKIRNKGPSNDALDQTVTRNTTEAIARGVFGAPSYVFENGDVVRGQDRLQFVEMKLASMA